MTETTQMLSGADSVRAANEYRLSLAGRREQWPYVHVYPPPSAIDVFVLTSALVDVNVVVARYQVSAGKRFFLQAVILGCNIAFTPGAASFTVLRNAPPGLSDSQLMPEHGLVNIDVQVGSTTSGPFQLQRAREFAALDIIQVNAFNVSVPVSASNFFVCGLFGYEVPSLHVKPSR